MDALTLFLFFTIGIISILLLVEFVSFLGKIYMKKHNRKFLP